MTFFNVNGRFGSPTKGQPEFRNAADHLAYLDTLGVSRSLVWHTAALELNPTWGNHELLAELGRTRGAAERLVPAFVISTANRWERGGMADLRETMIQHQVRALRIFPGHLHHTLQEIEPVIERLADLKPTLLFDCRSLPPSCSLRDFAKHFPQLSIVYTNASWPQMATAFDLLAQTENVSIDISWLHTCGTVELMVREFGAERAVFGLGHRTNHGASIIDLMDADISEEARAQIAHRNLERMLGLPESSLPQPPNQKGALWNAIRDGRPCPVPIIDAHGHLGPNGNWMLAEQQAESQTGDILRRMDRLNIQQMVVSGTHALFGDPVSGNQMLEEIARPFPDRFLGYLGFNPRYAAELVPTFEDSFSRDFFIGFKLLLSYWQIPVTDPRLAPVWQYAHDHRLPILLHTWDDPYDFPMMLDEIVARYPQAAFILGHSGGVDTGRAAAIELASKHPNVYPEWCGSYQMTLPFEELIQQVGPDRILFGTDAALHSPAWELGRFLSLDLPDELLTPALGANMRRLLAARIR